MIQQQQRLLKIGGAHVSRVAFGCMSIGDSSQKGVGRHQWTIDNQDSALELLTCAKDNGINWFDTANVYSSGDSERMVGKLLKQVFQRRSEYFLATKFGLPMYDGINEKGCSRKHIFESIQESLDRLELDYVDKLIVHRFDETEPEEIMEALHDVVKSGRAHYIGASSCYAWEFARLQHVAEKNNWTKFVSMQNHYNLLYRQEECEMIPLLHSQNVLCTPWSPLARGVLARPPNESTKRSSMDPMMTMYSSQPSDLRIIEQVGKIAAKHGVARSAVALAWLLQNGCAPVIGVTSREQLVQTLDCLYFELTSEEMDQLEQYYEPKPHGIGIGRDANAWDPK